MRELSFAQFVHYLRKVRLFFNFWIWIVNFIIQKLKNKHTLNDKIHSYVITYSEVSIKRPGLNFSKETLLNDQVHLNFMLSYKRTSCFYQRPWFVFFEKVSIKQPVPFLIFLETFNSTNSIWLQLISTFKGSFEILLVIHEFVSVSLEKSE